MASISLPAVSELAFEPTYNTVLMNGPTNREVHTSPPFKRLTANKTFSRSSTTYHWLRYFGAPGSLVPGTSEYSTSYEVGVLGLLRSPVASPTWLCTTAYHLELSKATNPTTTTANLTRTDGGRHRQIHLSRRPGIFLPSSATSVVVTDLSLINRIK